MAGRRLANSSPTSGDKGIGEGGGGPLVGMHGPSSLSSQEDRLECLHALHEGVICFHKSTCVD